MHAATPTAFADLSRSLICLLPLGEADRLATAWRHSLREVADHLRFICQHQKTVAERDEMLTATIRLHSARNVEQAAKLLSHRLPLYAAAVRRVSEYENQMELSGVAFARSSEAWEF